MPDSRFPTWPSPTHNQRMTRDELLALLRSCPLIASVQADPGTPVAHPETLARLAQASLDQGVKVLRLQGIDNIRVVRQATGVPTIGLIKKVYDGCDVYITPTTDEVDALLALGCEVIALDGTPRPRPNNTQLKDLISRIHAGGALAMADCDCLESTIYADEAGADLIGTTMAGYTAARTKSDGPDLDLLRSLVTNKPIIAEGRYNSRWQVEAALLVGATAVVVGGAINDPVKQTRALMPRPRATGKVGAVDIGGTWLRFATFSDNWELLDRQETPNPKNRGQLLAWVRQKVQESGVCRLGVGTGGIVDPATGEVWNAKEYLMPDHIGIRFAEDTTGVPTYAHGDGHATAWGHACLKQYVGRRVATLTIGTGLGAGFVEEGRIWAGRRGEYPRVNDLPTALGRTYEDLLGGIYLTKEPTESAMADAIKALEGAIQVVRDLYFPDDIVIGGSVGLSPWLRPHVERLGAQISPRGTDAGLYGAAALALFPAQ